MANDKKALLPLIVALVASLLCFCSPLPAFADDAVDDSPAYEVWQQYKDSSVSEFNLYKQVAEDLAYRWFMASDAKRSKVPLQSKALGSYKQLTQYAEDYDTPEEQWNAFYDDFHPSYIVRMYSLVTYEDSLSTWSVSDNYAYQHYKEWYSWFNAGSSSGGEQGDSDLVDEYYVYPIDHILSQSEYDSLGDDRIEWVAVNKDFAETLNNMGVTKYTYIYAKSYHHPELGKYWWGAMTAKTIQPYGSNGTFDFGEGNMKYLTGFQGTVYSQVVSDTELGVGVIVQLHNYDGVITASTVYWPHYAWATNTVAYYSGPIISDTVIVYDPSSSDPVYPVDPEPVTPDLPTPSNPIYVDNDNTTTTVDLTPILDALRAINTNIVAGFTAIEDDFAAFVEYFGEWQDALWSELRSVNAWLERIFYKTSGGGSSDEPDIIIDGDGWWSWLGTIASMLIGDLGGAVAGLSGAFDALHGLFPFSIPWDVAALLGLFVSDPVTPVFDVPLPFGFADGTAQTASVHVDLTAWDGVMAAVRSVELAIFALGLALKTRDMLRNTEVEQ